MVGNTGLSVPHPHLVNPLRKYPYTRTHFLVQPYIHQWGVSTWRLIFRLLSPGAFFYFCFSFKKNKHALYILAIQAWNQFCKTLSMINAHLAVPCYLVFFKLNNQ